MTGDAQSARDRGLLLPAAFFSILVLTAIYIGPVRAKLILLEYPDSNFWLRYLAASVIGGLVGYSEVVLRYRDEPLQALTSLPGITFVLLNSAAAALTLFLVEYLGAPAAGAQAAAVTKAAAELNTVPAHAGNVVQRVLLAGVGAMLVLRGKLLSVPLPQGGQAELGLAPLIEAILSSVNRSIDRERAYVRLVLVPEVARGMADLGFRRVAPFLRVGLQALQTLDTSTQQDVLADIASLERDTLLSDVAKLEAIGYDLLNNFGKRCFIQVFAQAKLSAEKDIALRPILPPLP